MNKYKEAVMKKNFSYILMSLSLAFLMFINTSNIAFAQDIAESVIISSDHQGTLLDTVTYVFDANGNCRIIESNDIIPYSIDDLAAVSFTFYDIGTKDGYHNYEVEMTAKTIEPGDYFTYSSVQVKPQNNSSYLNPSTASYPSYQKKTLIENVASFRYKGEGPDNPYVKVKGKVTLNGETDYNIPEHTLRDSIS